MAHAYHIPIRVWCSQNTKRIPVVLSWRHARYRVLEIFSQWHLADRWWVSPADASQASQGQSNRHYCRLRCQELALRQI